MKLMTYNILTGGKERLPLIFKIIRKENPDFLAVQEAYKFSVNDHKQLDLFARELDFPYYDCAPATKFSFDVASFSKYPFLDIKKGGLIQNSYLITKIKSDIGEITVCNAHPNPYSEDERLEDLEKILKQTILFPNPVICGDMNSLSPDDTDPHNIINMFDEHLLKRYTTDKKLRNDCIKKILANGFVDSAVLTGKNKIPTAPTGTDLHEVWTIPHTQPQLRIDYIFITSTLRNQVKNYHVVNSSVAAKASDHYPVVVNLR